MKTRRSVWALAATAALLSVGCGSSVDDGSGGSGGGSGGGGEGGAGGQAPSYFDLYACEIPLACSEMTMHTSIEPADAPVCAGQLIASGERGLLKTNFAPGPYPSSFRAWIYVLGDGTAIAQGSGRPCTVDGCTGPTLGPHERCNIEGYDALVADCDPLDDEDPDCRWDAFGSLVDCQAIDEQDCESVVAFQVQGGE
jgi:hypothetical protein